MSVASLWKRKNSSGSAYFCLTASVNTFRFLPARAGYAFWTTCTHLACCDTRAGVRPTTPIIISYHSSPCSQRMKSHDSSGFFEPFQTAQPSVVARTDRLTLPLGSTATSQSTSAGTSDTIGATRKEPPGANMAVLPVEIEWVQLRP